MQRGQQVAKIRRRGAADGGVGTVAGDGGRLAGVLEDLVGGRLGGRDGVLVRRAGDGHRSGGGSGVVSGSDTHDRFGGRQVPDLSAVVAHEHSLARVDVQLIGDGGEQGGGPGAVGGSHFPHGSRSVVTASVTSLASREVIGARWARRAHEARAGRSWWIRAGVGVCATCSRVARAEGTSPRSRWALTWSVRASARSP